VEKARETGLLPHELLLAISQGKRLPGLGSPNRRDRIDAAKAAAPYYAPRLMAMAVKQTTSDNPFEELLRLVDGGSRGLPAQARITAKKNEA
jgi:hypothetical protein